MALDERFDYTCIICVYFVFPAPCNFKHLKGRGHVCQVFLLPISRAGLCTHAVYQVPTVCLVGHQRGLERLRHQAIGKAKPWLNTMSHLAYLKTERNTFCDFLRNPRPDDHTDKNAKYTPKFPDRKGSSPFHPASLGAWLHPRFPPPRWVLRKELLGKWWTASPAHLDGCFRNDCVSCAW